jgi:RHS repeat-associated protein
MSVPSGPNAGTYFYCYDGNGNVVALVNAANRSIAANYEYGPFGELIRATGPMAKINPFLLSTKFCDWETGLYYYGYRYYNPSTGRWLSRDPLGEQAFLTHHCVGQSKTVCRLSRMQPLNPCYVFVENQPVNFFDLLGLDNGQNIENKCKCITCADKESLRRGLQKAANILDGLAQAHKDYGSWSAFMQACANAGIQAVGQPDGVFGGYLTGAGNLTDGQKCIVLYFESKTFTLEPGNGDHPPLAIYHGNIEEYINDWMLAEENRDLHAVAELAGAEKLEGCNFPTPNK